MQNAIKLPGCSSYIYLLPLIYGYVHMRRACAAPYQENIVFMVPNGRPFDTINTSLPTDALRMRGAAVGRLVYMVSNGHPFGTINAVSSC